MAYKFAYAVCTEDLPYFVGAASFADSYFAYFAAVAVAAAAAVPVDSVVLVVHCCQVAVECYAPTCPCSFLVSALMEARTLVLAHWYSNSSHYLSLPASGASSSVADSAFDFAAAAAAAVAASNDPDCRPVDDAAVTTTRLVHLVLRYGCHGLPVDRSDDRFANYYNHRDRFDNCFAVSLVAAQLTVVAAAVAAAVVAAAAVALVNRLVLQLKTLPLHPHHRSRRQLALCIVDYFQFRLLSFLLQLLDLCNKGK